MCLHRCTHVHIHTRAHTQKHTCTYTNARTHAHTYTHAHMHSCTHTTHTHAHARMHAHNTHTHTTPDTHAQLIVICDEQYRAACAKRPSSAPMRPQARATSRTCAPQPTACRPATRCARACACKLAVFAIWRCSITQRALRCGNTKMRRGYVHAFNTRMRALCYSVVETARRALARMHTRMRAWSCGATKMRGGHVHAPTHPRARARWVAAPLKLLREHVPARTHPHTRAGHCGVVQNVHALIHPHAPAQAAKMRSDDAGQTPTREAADNASSINDDENKRVRIEYRAILKMVRAQSLRCLGQHAACARAHMCHQAGCARKRMRRQAVCARAHAQRAWRCKCSCAHRTHQNTNIQTRIKTPTCSRAALALIRGALQSTTKYANQSHAHTTAADVRDQQPQRLARACAPGAARQAHGRAAPPAQVRGCCAACACHAYRAARRRRAMAQHTCGMAACALPHARARAFCAAAPVASAAHVRSTQQH